MWGAIAGPLLRDPRISRGARCPHAARAKAVAGPEPSLAHPLVAVVFLRGSGILAASTREGRQSASARRSGSKVSIACRPAGRGGPASPRWSRGRLPPRHGRPLRRHHGRPARPAGPRARGPAAVRAGLRGSAAAAGAHDPGHRRGHRRRARARAACTRRRAAPSSTAAVARRPIPERPAGSAADPARSFTAARRAQVSAGGRWLRRGSFRNFCGASTASARAQRQQTLAVGRFAVQPARRGPCRRRGQQSRPRQHALA